MYQRLVKTLEWLWNDLCVFVSCIWSNKFPRFRLCPAQIQMKQINVWVWQSTNLDMNLDFCSVKKANWVASRYRRIVLEFIISFDKCHRWSSYSKERTNIEHKFNSTLFLCRFTKKGPDFHSFFIEHETIEVSCYR